MSGPFSEEEVADAQRQVTAAVGALAASSTGVQQCEHLQTLVSLSAVLLPGRPVADPVGLAKALRPLLSSPSAYVRAATLRCMCHFVRDVPFIAACWRYKLDWWVARAMDRQKSDREREMAFRLVHAIVDLIAEAGRALQEERECPPSAKREDALGKPGTTADDPDPRYPFLFPSGSRSSVPSLDTMGLLSTSIDLSRPLHKSVSSDFAQSSSRIAPPDCRQLDVPLGLLQRLISVAEAPDDVMRRTCVLMLRNLAPYRCRALCQTHGLRALLQAMVDPRMADLSPSLAITFLWILDHYPTRRHLRLNLDLPGLLTSFTERLGKDPKEVLERMRAARAVVLLLLRTWAGLICLTNDPHALRTLVDVLRAPGPSQRKAVLFDLFTQAILNAAPHRAIPPFLTMAEEGPPASSADPCPLDAHSLRRAFDVSTLSFNDASGDAASDHPFAAELTSEYPRRPATPQTFAGYNSLDTFLGALLLFFDHCGLTHALVDLVQDPSDDLVSVQAARLLQLMFRFTDTLFPKPFALRMHASFDRILAAMIKTTRRVLELPSAEEDGADPEGRPAAQRQNYKVLTMVTALHQSLLATQRQSSNKVLAKGEALPFQMAVLVDDNQLKVLLNEAYILATKDFTRWNTERILVLLRGPLRSHPRLLEALKTKFFKRLLSFLRPSKRLFAEMPYREENLIWALIGCRVIDLLLLSPEGTRYLQNSGLLTEIHSCLEAELAPRGEGAPPPPVDRVFSKDRIAYSMSREYIRFIGRCTETASGLELLQAVGLLKTLAALTESDRHRDDLCHQILKFMHFGRVDHAPMNEYTGRILDNAMRHSSKPIRLFATLQLRHCLKPATGPADEVNAWCLGRLLRQMDDGWRDVAACAYHLLTECCLASDECLEFIIQKSPNVERLSEYPGQGLLMQMLHRSSGFEFLRSNGWVESQMHAWSPDGAQQYVYQLEADIQRVMAGAPLAASLGDRTHSPASALCRRPCVSGGSFSMDAPSLSPTVSLCAMPVHFYGELCSSPEGLEYFRGSGVFEDLRQIVAQYTAAPAAEEREEGAEAHEDSDSEASQVEGEEAQNLSFELFHSLGETSHHHKECVKRMLEEAEMDTQHVSRKAQEVRREGVFCTQPISSAYTPVARPPTRSIRVADCLLLRSALWALGHIGSTDRGLPLLLEAGLVARIADLASYSDCLSFRGTALGALGLIARRPAGRAELQRLQWHTHHCCDAYVSQDGLSYSVALAYPINHRPLLMLPEGRATRQPLLPPLEWNTPTRRATKPSVRIRPAARDLADGSPSAGTEGVLFTGTLHTVGSDVGAAATAAEILKAVKSLSNPVMQDQASKELKRIRQQSPAVFQNPWLAADVYALMSAYRYRPNVRRFLYDFFDGAAFTTRVFDRLDAAHVGAGPLPPSDAERQA